MTANADSRKRKLNIKSRYQPFNLHICNVHCKASLTIEASIVLPIFLSIVMALMSFMEVLQIQTRIQVGMKEAVTKATGYYYVLENMSQAEDIGGKDGEELASIIVQGAITSAYLKQSMVSFVGADYLNNSWIDGGQNGITVWESAFPDADGNLDMMVTYKIKVPFLPNSLGTVKMTQRECQRVWHGNKIVNNEDKEDSVQNEDRQVYITETGSVYHTNINCSYIKLSVKQIRHNEVVNYRSEDGSKYYACERCKKGGSGFFVYITSSGNRYHTDPECSALRRNVKTVWLSEVKDRRCCSRCENAGKKD